MLRDTFQTGVEDLRARTEKGSVLDDARKLLRLREELDVEETRLAEERLGLARRYLAEGDVVRVEVPRDELEAWFQEEKPADGAR